MDTQNDISLKLIDNRNRKRFEFELEDGATGIIDYKLQGSIVKALHTFVPEDLRGNGYGTAMVENMLSYISDNKSKIIPVCSFVEDYLEDNSEWEHLIYKTDTSFSE